MKNIFFLIFLFLALLSCTKQKKSETLIFIPDFTSRVKELKKQVLTKGDTQAYRELSTFFSSQDYPEEYIIYSLIMANKYKYPPAYYDVYYNLTITKSRVSENLDETTKSLALDYLKKGASLKDPNALSDLGYLYLDGKLVKKDTIIGKRLLEESKSIIGF